MNAIQKTSLFLTLTFFLGGQVSGNEKSEAARLLQLGNSEYQKRNIVVAIEYYRKSILQNPNYVPALQALGKILRETGAIEESNEKLLIAYELEPKNITTLIELTETSIEKNDMLQAQKYCREGLLLESTNIDLSYLQVQVLLSAGNLYLAEQRLNQIIRQNPGHYKSYISLGRIYLKQDKLKKAENLFRKARTIMPNQPYVFIYLADIKLEQLLYKYRESLYSGPASPSMFAEAIQLLMNAKGYDNFFVPANFRLAQIYALTSDCLNATPYLDSVLEVNRDHYGAIYLKGYCDKSQSIDLYPQLLQDNSNDDITRFIYEKNLLELNKRRQDPLIMAAVRNHFDTGKSLLNTNQMYQGIFEIQYARYLFPDFREAQIELLEYYRSQGDYFELKRFLGLLRQSTGERYYQDMYEQLISSRRQKLYYREGITNPESVKSPTPLFIFYFQPNDPFTLHPDAGVAIAELMAFALKDRGRLQVHSREMRSIIYRALQKQKYFGTGGYYNGKVSSFVYRTLRQLQDQTGDSPMYAIGGNYSEKGNSIEVFAQLINLRNGTQLASVKYSAEGRGFLRRIALQLANFAYDNIPYSGKILKISGSGAVVNLGLRDGINNETKLLVKREANQITELKVVELEKDIFWGEPLESDDVYLIQPGDEVIVTQRKK